ncbi:tail tube protein [uncultured Caudovirales phage]|jgi:hypothetical protein|uniref:Tail tube protein n=1 Tax=uncultured Caudovirales phage TaxID=2100421 RepID=A0A6J5M5K1_9CAUD|nr:tail tube protein [uncultured Caudovirales phage]
MFNIAEFSGNLNKYGTIQTNKFMVEIPAPTILGPSALDEVMLYRATNARIPGAALDVQRVFRYGVGPEQKFPTNVNFTDINVTFVDTVDNDIWKRFSVWLNGIFDFTGSSGGGQASYTTEYKQYYTSDLKIFVFDNEAKLRNTVVLKEAFPTTISEVGVSWSENNKLYEFSVGFAFKEWYFDGYGVGQPFRSGATLGPAQTTTPRPTPPVSTPRPTSPPRSDPFGLSATPNNETGTQGPANYGSFNF